MFMDIKIIYYISLYIMSIFIVQLFYLHNDLPKITTYYEFNIEQLDIFEYWYNTFDEYYIENMLISRETIQYKLIETLDEINFLSNFIKLFDKPFDLLEKIDDLIDIFDIKDNISNKSDNSLLEETESINNLIMAHLNGDETNVKRLLLTIKSDDDIVNDIKKKLKK